MDRNNKNNFKCLLKNFKFKSINLSFSKQLTLLGGLISFISLFLPWIKNTENGNIWNSFNSLSGNIGYLLLIILLIIVFVLFSTTYKEKIKLYSDLSIKNHFIIITSGISIITFSIILLSFTNGLNIFFESITHGKGVILSMTSGIIILIGGILLRKEYYSKDSEIILNKFNLDKENSKKEDNMKLPF